MIALAALAAVSASAQQDAADTAAAVQQPAAPAPALNYSPQRYRLLPPYADPGFVRSPVPPPDKEIGSRWYYARPGIPATAKLAQIGLQYYW